MKFSVPLGPNWWQVALSSIGDGVIATGADGRVVFMNTVAERLTGWTLADAEGRPLVEPFHIVNETTRVRAENPVEKVLALGYTVGLANHTVLIRRDGSELPIDDSAAPIRDPNGALLGVVLVFRDVSQRRQTEISQGHLAAIIESSDDAIVSKDLNGIITSWNRGAERIFGYAAAEAVGKHITIIIPSDRYTEEYDILQRLRRGERTDHFETVRVRKDGSTVDISLTVSPIRDTYGTIVGASKVARDITSQKKVERNRERMLEAAETARTHAEEANRLKDEFLATVSHELRTPLSSIIGWATLLRAGKVQGAAAVRAYETIERNAKKQVELVEDLLDVSRIVSGKLRFELRPLMLPAIIESAVNAVRPTADANKIHLRVVLAPDAGPIAGDTARLEQVVWNLLTNAIKFTPEDGEVTVTARRMNEHAEIVVSDTGKGIDAGFLPHVFDRFAQADSTTTRSYGGLGLGLAIVRHIVELHGGTVSAESNGEGKGATFFIRLPLMSGRTSEAEVGDGSHTRITIPALPSLDGIPDLHGIKVLIVDDEEDSRELLRMVLMERGAETREAASSVEAVREAKTWNPSIVVSDIGMPAEDGYQFIQQFRALEQQSGSWTPAVALTAYARAEDRLRALAAGYQIHLTKPIDPAELVLVIASQLGRGKLK